MKKQILTVLIILLGWTALMAQDTFQTALFPAETILKHRSELELSEAQIALMKKIYNENIEAFNTAKWDLDAAQVDLNKLVEKSKVDEQAALDKMDEIAALEQKLKKKRLKMLIKLKNELSVSQQTKLKMLRKDTDLSTHKLTASISESPRIVLRGSASKDGETPLFVFINKKGEVKYKSTEAKAKLENLNPDKIETVNVLKGESAISKYGEEGKNGVIEIKTKQ